MKALCPGQHLPHYKSMGKFFYIQGRVTPNRIVQSRPNSSQDFMPVLIICKSDEDPIKNEDTIDRTTFSPL